MDALDVGVAAGHHGDALDVGVAAGHYGDSLDVGVAACHHVMGMHWTWEWLHVTM